MLMRFVVPGWLLCCLLDGLVGWLFGLVGLGVRCLLLVDVVYDVGCLVAFACLLWLISFCLFSCYLVGLLFLFGCVG